VLAYSTVSQLGFMMFSIGIGAIFASQFHLMSHAVFKALLFLSAGAIIHEVGTRNMCEMGCLYKDMKLTAVCFGAGSLALMGIPVFNGFFSKDMILGAAYASGNYIPLLFASVAAVFTVIYTLRMYSMVFLGVKRTGHASDAPWQMTLPLIILAAASAVSWLLVTRFNRAMIASGIEIEHLSFGEFFHEMFLSPVTLITAAILAAGIALFYYRKAVRSALDFVIDPFLAAASLGFGFDILYNKGISVLLSSASYVSKVFDEGILNGLNYLTAASAVSLASLFRKTHTGNLNLNLTGMALGIIFVLVYMFWR